jgi:DNA helicase HerA-like ATPase
VANGAVDHSTRIGQIASVRGGVVRVRLSEMPSTLVMVNGESYRVGQIGAFLRVPLGYTNLYGICTQVGADAAPLTSAEDESSLLEEIDGLPLTGFRWLTLVLFGESVGGHFDRGIGVYPTVGDSVHLVTPNDLDVIYSDQEPGHTITVGRIAGSAGLAARLNVSALVSRHSCVVGSTGAGKSNLVAVVVDALTTEQFPSSRIVIIDPHGEYASAVGDKGKVVTTGVEDSACGSKLRVPYWALPFDELVAMTLGGMQPAYLESLREQIRELKVKASQFLSDPPPEQSITADSPIPFSIRHLWLRLEHQELQTFEKGAPQDDDTRYPADDDGDAETMRPPKYPYPTSTNSAPFYFKARWGIRRQLDLLRTRILDSRFSFMFDPTDDLHPDEDGRTNKDLHQVIADWVGGPEPVTVLDVSGLPSEVLSSVVGTMMQLIYGALFWAMDLPVGGRQQPLLVVLDEAHRFLPTGGDNLSHRVFGMIAKEGRKYGVGLMVVSQRPSDVDSGILSQCGTMIALRVSNPQDRGAVSASVPDDLGGLIELLPSLRTGEALVLGDALQVPSRVRIDKAHSKPVGADPELPRAWQNANRPDVDLYKLAVINWRAQSTSAASQKEK